MLPILLTEDDKGEFRIDSNPIATDNNGVSIMIENDMEDDREASGSSSPKAKFDFNEASKRHHSIYEEWTRMTPQEISHWIDK